MRKHWKRMMTALLAIVMAVTMKGDSATGHGNDMSAPQQTTVEQMFLIHGSGVRPSWPKHGDAGRSSVWAGASTAAMRRVDGSPFRVPSR